MVVHFNKSFMKTISHAYMPSFLGSWNRSGEWGDHVTLQAAADWVRVTILHFFISPFFAFC